MLITQPAVMWCHKGACLRLCSTILSLFPKALASVTLSWAEYTSISQLHMHYRYSGYALVMMALVLTLYGLSLYTYFKVISVGAGSPSDFSLLRMAPRRSDSPYDSPYDPPASSSAKGSPATSPSAAAPSDLVTPPHWLLTSHHIEANATSYRSCTTCQAWKPDRCHHCSVCGRCFLKMDHHCPWFASCIGFRNHKFFIQLLIYITMFSGVVLAISVDMLYGFFVDGQYNDNYLLLSLVFLFVVAVVFFVSVGCFMAFLVYLVLRNTTTIEFQDSHWGGSVKASYEYDRHGKRRSLGHIYDLGVGRNWRATMGPRWYHWCFPVAVTSTAYDNFNNGLNFLVDEDVYQKHLYNAQLQLQLNSQLQEYRDRIRGVSND